MRIISRLFIFTVSAFVFISCINKKSTTTFDEASRVSLIGIYKGDLPCVDCDAISTVLHLGRDNSYKLTYVYEGKSNDAFTKEGSWTVNKNYLVLNGVDYKYKIEPDYLVQLDLAGQVIKGDLAEKYQLEKIK